MYGRDPPPLLCMVEKFSKVKEVDNMIMQKNEILDRLKGNLITALKRIRQTTNKGKREIECFVGDQVFLKLHPYRFRFLSMRPNKKLSSYFYNPYEVKENVGQVVTN